jgi:hypothetical protein
VFAYIVYAFTCLLPLYAAILISRTTFSREALPSSRVRVISSGEA